MLSSYVKNPYIFLSILMNFNGIICQEYIARFYRLTKFTLGKLLIKIGAVRSSIPWFNADKWSIFFDLGPDSNQRCVKVDFHIFPSLWREDGNLMDLVIFNDHSVIVKKARFDGQSAIFRIEKFCLIAHMAVRTDDTALERLFGIKDKEIILLLSVFVEWTEEAWMGSDGEVECLVVWIFHFPHHFHAGTGNRIADP